MAQDVSREGFEKKAAEVGLAIIDTKGGPKVVNASLSQPAKDKIVEVINSSESGQQVKAEYLVSSNGKDAAMRIDLVGQLGRISDHAGAKVPHAQIDRFMQLRPGMTKQVPLTGVVGEIELTSDDVLAVFANPASPVIQKGSRLFTAIEEMVAALDPKYGLSGGDFTITFVSYG